MVDKKKLPIGLRASGFNFAFSIFLQIPPSRHKHKTRKSVLHSLFKKKSFSMKMVIKESDWIGGLGLHVPCCLSLTHTSLVSQHSLERRQDSSLSAHCLKIEQKCD